MLYETGSILINDRVICPRFYSKCLLYCTGAALQHAISISVAFSRDHGHEVSMSREMPLLLKIIGRQSEGSIIRGFINQKWVPYSQRYLFNAIPDTNHNANPSNPNRYSKGNPNPTNRTNPNTRYGIIEPSDYRYITLLKTLTSAHTGSPTRLSIDKLLDLRPIYYYPAKPQHSESRN